MVKRKGFMSLEMLLVIGVLVAGLAGVFAIYKKIQSNNASMQVTQDIATILNGLDRYKGATGGYPDNTVGAPTKITTQSTGVTWNGGFSYVAADVSSRWNYKTVLDSAIDPTTQTGTGYVILSTSQTNFAALKPNEVRDILKGKCLNGTVPAAGVPAVNAHNSECVISANTVIYDAL